jgi:hypothetical protein
MSLCFPNISLELTNYFHLPMPSPFKKDIQRGRGDYKCDKIKGFTPHAFLFHGTNDFCSEKRILTQNGSEAMFFGVSFKAILLCYLLLHSIGKLHSILFTLAK